VATAFLVFLEVVLLVGGVVAIAVSDPNVAQCQSTIGQLGQGVSSSLKQTCTNYQVAHFLGIVAVALGGVGLVVTLAVALIVAMARR
jgi:hypothetical protein